MGIGRTETDSLKVHDFLGLDEDEVDLVLEREEHGVDRGVVSSLLGMTDIGDEECRNQERRFDLEILEVGVCGACPLP